MIDNLPHEQPDPYLVFTHWFHEHSTNSKATHPGACVLSTIGLDGFPNARYLSLKLIEVPFLIFGGSLDSRKALEIDSDHNVALTFWWEETKRQVRVQGVASKTSDEHSDFLFNIRNKEAQIVSSISEQGADLQSWENLNDKFNTSLSKVNDKIIPRPENWSGFKVEPIRFEFMEFEENRLHRRTLFSKVNEDWIVKLLQP
jgi:pyridoxamine 5'-phosphate oxidase